MLSYKGYIGLVIFDDEADIFHGEVINTRDVITFQGQTTDEIKNGLKDSVDVYLDYCKKKNRAPDKPFSGNFMIRSTPEKHSEFMIAAKRTGLSLNRWVNEVLDQAAHPVHQPPVPTRLRQKPVKKIGKRGGSKHTRKTSRTYDCSKKDEAELKSTG